MEEQDNIVERLPPDRARFNKTRLLNVCPVARRYDVACCYSRPSSELDTTHHEHWITRLPTYLPTTYLQVGLAYLLAELPCTPTDLLTERDYHLGPPT